MQKSILAYGCGEGSSAASADSETGERRFVGNDTQEVSMMGSRKVFAAVLSVLFLSVGAAWAGDGLTYSEARSVSEVENIDVSQVGGILPVRDAADIKEGYPISLRGALIPKSSDGSRFRLEDDTGSIVVVLPEDVREITWTGYSSSTMVDVYGTVHRDAANDDRPYIVARHIERTDTKR